MSRIKKRIAVDTPFLFDCAPCYEARLRIRHKLQRRLFPLPSRLFASGIARLEGQPAFTWYTFESVLCHASPKIAEVASRTSLAVMTRLAILVVLSL